MSSWGIGGFGSGPWGGGLFDLGLIRELVSRNSNPNEITLNWKKPNNYDTSMELIIVRRKDAFPMELYNDDPLYTSKVNTSGFTDPAQVEIFRGKLIRGSSGVGTTNLLTDSLASFPVSPSLKGRILRDSESHNFRILSNTLTTITIDGTPASGQYVILVDFPNSNELQLTGTSTSVGAGFLRDNLQTFLAGELRDRVLVDSIGNRFIIVNNDINIISVSGTPTAGDYIILQEFADFVSPSSTIKGQFGLIDTFKNTDEAISRTGTGLENEQFYYYTGFTHRINGNAAEAVFATIFQPNTTQTSSLSTKFRDFQAILEKLWPNVALQTDSTGDFSDLMNVFGFGFNEIYSFVNTFNLTNPDKMYYTILPDTASQLGLTPVGNQLGMDTHRRVISDLLPTFRKKGSKAGIVDFIRIITTWDATSGTGDDSSIIDDAPNAKALRFFSDTLGSNNTRLFGFKPSFINSPFVSYTYTFGTGIIQYGSSVDLSTVEVGDTFVDGADNIFDVLDVDNSLDQIMIDVGQTVDTSAEGNIYKKTPLSDVGRFFITLPGVVIPGFFTFREFLVQIKDVALWVGESSNLIALQNQTQLEDSLANFGGIDNLKGNFLIPKQGQINDIFRIVSNTATTITVEGVARDLEPVGNYAVLSPLNAARYQRLIELMKEFAPSFARMGLEFI